MNRAEKHFIQEIASTLWGVGGDVWLEDRFESYIDILGQHTAMTGEESYRPLMDIGKALFLSGGGKEVL